VSYPPDSPRDPTYSVSLAFMMNGAFYRLGFGVVGRLMETATEGHTINVELIFLKDLMLSFVGYMLRHYGMSEFNRPLEALMRQKDVGTKCV